MLVEERIRQILGESLYATQELSLSLFANNTEQARSSNLIKSLALQV